MLFAKNEDAVVPPASMAKLMTMEVVFDALKKGEITPTTAYPVSEHAWRTGGAPSGTPSSSAIRVAIASGIWKSSKARQRSSAR